MVSFASKLLATEINPSVLIALPPDSAALAPATRYRNHGRRVAVNKRRGLVAARVQSRFARRAAALFAAALAPSPVLREPNE
jgi:hypothetical protein